MKVAIQGAVGSFHFLAARRWFGDEFDAAVECDTFEAVFEALKQGKADKAIIAVENSLYGSISEVYDLLLRYRFPVVGEIPERIRQQLIGYSGTPLTAISQVFSQSIALNQCTHWLDAHVPGAERTEWHDTADAVRHIAELGDPGVAAIAGHEAAALHGMSVLAENIEDDAQNYTRFLVLDPNGTAPTDADKASLVLRTSHQPGALYRALGVFARADANLTKVQSRPIRGQVFRYQFFIDVLADPTTLEHIQRELRTQGCELTILGHYRQARSETIG